MFEILPFILLVMGVTFLELNELLYCYLNDFHDFSFADAILMP